MRQEFAFFTGLLNLPHQLRDICDTYANPCLIASEEVLMASLGALFHPLSMPMTFAHDLKYLVKTKTKYGCHKLLCSF